jgi:hypothetical protein
MSSFVGKHSCYSFTPASIRQNAPALPGVYALSNAREWVFVAQADDVQAALRAHLGAPGTRLRAASVTGFTFEVCERAMRPARVARLILELSPSCNEPSQP